MIKSGMKWKLRPTSLPYCDVFPLNCEKRELHTRMEASVNVIGLTAVRLHIQYVSRNGVSHIAGRASNEISS